MFEFSGKEIILSYKCDRCKVDLPVEQLSKPFIRIDKVIRAAASILVVDDRGKQMNELCDQCKLAIILDGTPSDTLTIPHDPANIRPLPPPTTAETAEPERPPTFEPSLKT